MKELLDSNETAEFGRYVDILRLEIAKDLGMDTLESLHNGLDAAMHSYEADVTSKLGDIGTYFNANLEDYDSGTAAASNLILIIFFLTSDLRA